jgi:RNA polymerase sigma-70 factor (ECF subfamily)
VTNEQLNTAMSDLELLRRYFAGGDRRDFAELAARYEAPLLGLAHGLLSGRSDLAQDAVQDAWMRVVRSGKHFEGKSSVKTWLYRIVINRCADLRARHARRGAAEWSEDHAAAGTVPPLEAAAVVASEASDCRAGLRRVMETLPEGTRLILLLCYHDGLGHEEAAEVLGLPVGTLKSRLGRALEELRSRPEMQEYRS